MSEPATTHTVTFSRPAMEFYRSDAPLCSLFGGVGSGKAGLTTTPVLTPTGWRMMGDIKPGDFVIGSTGRAVKVVAVHPQGLKPVNVVTFHDGTATHCCNDHLWTAREFGRKTRTGERRPWRTVTTAVLAHKYRNGPPSQRWSVPVVQPVEFEARDTRDGYRTPPYLLGMLIGNGGLTTASVVLSLPDDETVESARQMVPCGIRVRRRTIGGIDYTLCGDGGPNPIISDMRRLGLMGKGSHEKSIPREYLMSSPCDRMELLRGLMDTDGTLDTRSGTQSTAGSYCTTSRQLAEDVCFLVRSLGGEARLGGPYIKSFTYKGEKKQGRPAYIVNVKTMFNPFKLARKAGKWNTPTKYKPTKVVTGVVPAGVGDCVCITVDADDGLYVAEGFIVTHNSTALVYKVLRRVSQHQNSTGIVAANSYKQLHQATLESLRRACAAAGLPYVYGKRPPWFESRFADCEGIMSFPNGVQIITRTLEDPDLLRGPNLNWAALDETRDTKAESFQVVAARVRVRDGPNTIDIATSPSDTPDWLYDLMIAEPMRDPLLRAIRKYWTVTTWHNRRNLSPGYIETMRSMMDEETFRREMMGQWPTGGLGRCYTSFSRAANMLPVASVKYDPTARLYLSCDFNIQHMGWAIAQYQEVNGARVLVFIDEVYRVKPMDGKSATETGCIEFLKRYGSHRGDVEVHGDWTGRRGNSATTESDWKVIDAQLRPVFRNHYRNTVKSFEESGNPHQTDRVNAANALLRNAAGRVGCYVSEKCVKLIRDFERVSWKDGKREIDKSDSELPANISDSATYLIYDLAARGIPTRPVGNVSRHVASDGRDVMDGFRAENRP